MKAREHFRIICVIAAKDIIDALRNKLILTILASVAFMMLSSQVIGLIAGLKQETIVYIFDKGSSKILKDFVRSREMNLVNVRTLDDLQGHIGNAPGPSLGIVFPINFDEQMGSESRIELTAYASNRVANDQITVLIEEIENGLLAAGGIDAHLQLAETRAYPLEESTDYPMMLSFGLVMGVMSIGLILTPYLIIDEKTTHTMDAMLTSPAKHIHLVAGKLITGILYSLTGSLLIILVSWSWISNWGVLLTAILLGAVFSATIGLLTGVVFSNPSSINMMGGLIIVVLMMPMYFWPGISSRLSETLAGIVSWLPSIRMYRLVRQSFTFSPDSGAVSINMAILGAVSLATFGLLIFRVRALEK